MKHELTHNESYEHQYAYELYHESGEVLDEKDEHILMALSINYETHTHTTTDKLIHNIKIIRDSISHLFGNNCTTRSRDVQERRLVQDLEATLDGHDVLGWVHAKSFVWMHVGSHYLPRMGWDRNTPILHIDRTG